METPDYWEDALGQIREGELELRLEIARGHLETSQMLLKQAIDWKFVSPVDPRVKALRIRHDVLARKIAAMSK